MSVPLSSLPEPERSDVRVLGAVLAGDVVDDGAPVEDVPLRLALAAVREGRDVVLALEEHRYGAPWEAWVEAAVEGWAAVRWERRRALVAAVVLARASMAEEERRLARLLRAQAKAKAAYEAMVATSGRVVELIGEVCRGG